jgi:type III pantothenate kinase
MQSGIYYGYVGLVDGILGRLRREVPGLEAVVATGGQAKLIAADSEFIQTVDPMLTLEGLRYIHERLQG